MLFLLKNSFLEIMNRVAILSIFIAILYMGCINNPKSYTDARIIASNLINEAKLTTDIEFPEDPKLIFSEVLASLIDDFGRPPNLGDKEIWISIASKSKSSHAFVDISSNKREVFIDALNLIPENWHYIAHELFHAYFQDKNDLAHSLLEIERWASYAQYRYKYDNRSNTEISRILRDEYFAGKQPFAKNNNTISLSTSTLEKDYVENVLPFFDKSHVENVRFLTGSEKQDEDKIRKALTDMENDDQRTTSKVEVEAGDTLWKLARSHYKNLTPELKKLVLLSNPHISSPDLIRAGDTVYFPPANSNE